MASESTAYILLVDDTVAHLNGLAAVIEPLGHPILTATSGTEALRILLSKEVALILMDIDMPTMNGLETARLVRTRLVSRCTPVIFITARSVDEPEFLEAYRVGAVDFLTKPINPIVLCSKVSVFIDLFRQKLRVREQADLLNSLKQEAVRRDLERKHILELGEIAERQRQFVQDVLSGVTEGRLRLCRGPADLPSRGRTIAHPIALRKDASLRTLRQRTREAAVLCGLTEARTSDFVTAVSEAGMNAIVHGRGGQVRLCQSCDTGLQAWIKDHGPGIAVETLPRATLERGFSTAGSLGHGFWLMLNTADRLFVSTQPTGTTIVLEQGHCAPVPTW